MEIELENIMGEDESLEVDLSKEEVKEQIKFAITILDEIMEPIKGFKSGMPLYLPIVLNYYLVFHLRKKYNKIGNIFSSESFSNKFLGKYLDEMMTTGVEKFSLKDSFKKEMHLHLLSNFVKDNRYENLNLSTEKFIEYEEHVKEIILNTDNLIDDFFKEKDLCYSEISDVYELYELITLDQGETIQIHFGNFGFVINKDNSVNELINAVEKARNNGTLIREKMDQYNSWLFEKIKLFKEQFNLNNSVLNFILNLKMDTSYFRKDQVLSYVEDKINKKISIIDNLFSLFNFLKNSNSSIVKEIYQHKNFIINEDNVFIDKFSINFNEDLYKFEEYYINFLNSEELLSKIYSEVFPKENLFINISGNKIKFTKREKGKIIGEQVQSSSIGFNLVNNKIFRDTGEEVIDFNIIIFELEEMLRQKQNAYNNALTYSKNMFLSALSDFEIDLFNEFNMTFIEGNDYDYAINTETFFNSLYRIPKGKKLDELKYKDIIALCIYPEDPNTPIYDVYCTLALCIKSGDEEYIDEKSNKFTIRTTTFEKIKMVLSKVDKFKTIDNVLEEVVN